MAGTSAGPSTAAEPPVQHVGHMLLSVAQRLNGLSPEELDKKDCILIMSMRGGGATIAAHRCILELGSSLLTEEIRKVRHTHEQEGAPFAKVLRMDLSIGVVETVVRFLYTRERVSFTTGTVAELYSAGKLLEIAAIVEQAKAFISFNLGACLESADIILPTSHPQDIDMLSDAFISLNVYEFYRSMLIKRIRKWGGRDEERWKTVLACNRKLFPAAIVLQRRTSAAVLGYADGVSPKYSLTALSTMMKIWAGDDTGGETIPHSNSLIFHGQLYVGHRNKLHVRTLDTNDFVRSIGGFDNDITGMFGYRDKVFFSTATGVYLMNERGTATIKVADLNNLGLIRCFILSYASSQFTLAINEWETKILWAYTFVHGSLRPLRRVSLRKFGDDWKPVGCHDGLVYYVPEMHRRQSPGYYVGFRAGTEVKRHPIVDYHTYCDGLVHAGFLYLIYVNKTRKKCIKAINLNLDTIAFYKSYDELCYTDIFTVIPIVPVVAEEEGE